ncbi:MAG: IS630 transposase-related protein [Alphaproteobacteria bacterium]
MSASYSQDFRRKVIEHVKKGNSCHSASMKFEISSNTVRNWYKRYKLEGNFLPRKVGCKKGRRSKEEVESYVRTNPNFILSDMGKHFGMSGPGALYWLKKLGYSYKKKTSPMWKQAKKREVSIKD